MSKMWKNTDFNVSKELLQGFMIYSLLLFGAYQQIFDVIN